MADIKCSVSSCGNNDCGTCYACGVHIGGQSACEKSGTCCDSFIHSAQGFNNSIINSSTPAYSIACKAGNCKHNASGSCTLNSINVGSPTNATVNSDTQCQSFEE